MGFLTSPFFWLVIAILFIIIEVLEEPFGLLFFGIGALLAAFIAVFTQGFLLQFSVFIGGAFLGLFFFRASYLAMFRKKSLPTNVYGLVGKHGTVIEDIPAGERGTVRIGQEQWKARGTEEQAINSGEKVTIVSISGNTVLVKTLSED